MEFYRFGNDRLIISPFYIQVSVGDDISIRLPILEGENVEFTNPEPNHIKFSTATHNMIAKWNPAANGEEAFGHIEVNVITEDVDAWVINYNDLPERVFQALVAHGNNQPIEADQNNLANENNAIGGRRRRTRRHRASRKRRSTRRN